MCDTCGCGTSAVRTIEVNERLIASNAAAAEHNRAHFAAQGIFAINLMGTPGAGKTALLETTIRSWRESGGRLSRVRADRGNRGRPGNRPR
jgi:hydrogenase nickel incorporation protein HypB